MARLAGKVALISGGARGQGAVEAKMFVQEGAKVVFGDILDEAGKQVARLRGHVDALGVAPERAVDLTEMKGPEVHGLLICRRLD